MKQAVIRTVVVAAAWWCAAMLSPAIAQKQAEKPTERVVTPPKVNPMQVVLVRSTQPGCDTHCPEWIAAQGDIEYATISKFRLALKAMGDRKLPVLIDSAGGSVESAFEIGRMIRAKGLDVAVARTSFAPCADADDACRAIKASIVKSPLDGRSKCASSCVFILAAGAHRYVGPQSLVGVHRITTYQKRLREQKTPASAEPKLSEVTVVVDTKDIVYDNIRAYFTEMGIGERVTSLLMATPAASIRLLSRPELRDTHLITGQADGRQLVALGSPAAAWPRQTAAVASILPPAKGLGSSEKRRIEVGPSAEKSFSTGAPAPAAVEPPTTVKGATGGQLAPQ